MLNRRDFYLTVFAAAFAGGLGAIALGSAHAALSAKAARLAEFYDGLGVEQRWLAGVNVNWETGAPDGVPERTEGKHTHCSAFVAAVAKQLGIYILRPPEHGQVFLANAQSDWLAAAGTSQGWTSLSDADAAQSAANKGLFVVASYHNHNATKPGHIAIVRPSTKPAEQIVADGPDVIMAGIQNYTDTTLAHGFAGHPLAWARGREVRFFAHEWNFAALRSAQDTAFS